MKIGFDMEAYQKAKNRGIGNYTINICNTYFSLFPNYEYFFLSWNDDAILEDFSYGDDVIIRLTVGNPNDVTEKKKIIKKFVIDNQLDVYWDTAPMVRDSFSLPDTISNNVISIATAYDLIPYKYKSIFFDSMEQYMKYVKKMLTINRYNMIFSISEYTRKDIVKYCGVRKNKIFNIYMSGNKIPDENKVLAKDILKKYNIKGKYYLCVSGNGVHKNLLRLVNSYLRACEINKNIPQLVIVANLSDISSQIAKIFANSSKYSKKVSFIGFVSDVELSHIYKNAFWCICPSLYEGFGMPVLEAWNYNVPVIASTATSVGEISEGAAYMIDAMNINSIIESFLKTSDLSEFERNKYIEKGKAKVVRFTWENTVTKANFLIEKELKSKQLRKNLCDRNWLNEKIKEEKKNALSLWKNRSNVIKYDDSFIKINEYPLLRKWVLLNEEKCIIEKFFLQNNYRRIALYGLGFWGVRIFNYLYSKNNIQITCIIDKKGKSLRDVGYEGIINIISPNEIIPSVDCILITPILYADEIENEIRDKVDCPIIRLKDVIELL